MGGVTSACVNGIEDDRLQFAQFTDDIGQRVIGCGDTIGQRVDPSFHPLQAGREGPVHGLKVFIQGGLDEHCLPHQGVVCVSGKWCQRVTMICFISV